MGKKDLTTKEYLGNARRFADVCNYYLFDGKQTISPEDLKELDPSEWMTDSKGIHQKERDLLRKVVVRETGSCTIAIIGLENQSDIHYAMPVRSMLYDALNYDRQVKNIRKEHRNKAKEISENTAIEIAGETAGNTVTDTAEKKQKGAEFIGGFAKEDRILPVITLTVYWGTEDWDGPRDLYDMLAVSKEDKDLSACIDNYHLKLIEPLRMKEKDFARFTTDVRQVFQLIHAANDREQMGELLKTDPAYKTLAHDTAETIKTFLKVEVKTNQETEGEEINMCKAWEDNIKFSEERGRLLGREEGLQEGLQEGHEKGREEGLQEGREEGLQAGLQKTAEKMIRANKLALEEVAEYSGLPLAKVKELQQSICSGV